MIKTEGLGITPVGIPPHGGKLINRQLREDEYKAALEQAHKLPQIPLSSVSAADLEMIAIGAYSPLTGFMNQVDYERVVAEMRLANGLVWPIPITLPVDETLADSIKIGQDVALVQCERILAIMKVTDKFPYCKEQEAKQVYQTTETKHPGVARLYRQGNMYLGGDICLLAWPELRQFQQLPRTPAQTRTIFAEKKWRRIVGFQTRNPIHGAHEYIIENALQIADGFFLHPLMGETKPDDISAKVRFKSYQKLLRYHFRNTRQRVLLGVFPAPMRYAGPREAIFHALCRKNYGCTHFVVGRDHAGVGNYYDPTAACEIFQEFASGDEIGIELLCTPEITYYCSLCQRIVNLDECDHHQSYIRVSGTVIREMLQRGEISPEGMMRSQISKMLTADINSEEQEDKDN